MRIPIFSLVTAVLFTCSAQAGSRLAELVDEAGVGWMFGQWSGESDDGEAIKVSFKWDLAQHVVVSSIKTRDWEGHGLSMLNPISEEVAYHAADNRGIVAHGEWSGEDGQSTLIYRYETPSGESGRIGVVHSRATDGGMDVAVHRVNSWGQIEKPAMATLKLKKE